MDARYVCTNETSNNGKVVTTANNTNTSLTGIKIGTKTDYRYPSQGGTWQQLCYDFELTEEQTVTFSLGFRTSAGVGAANNTLLYVDNVRLFVGEEATGIETLSSSANHLPSATFDLQGRRVTTASMRRGVYIQNGKKFVVE